MAGNAKIKSVFVRTEFDYTTFVLKGRNRDTGDPRYDEYPSKNPKQFDSYEIDSSTTPIAELSKAHIKDIADFFKDKEIHLTKFQTFLCTKTPVGENFLERLNPWREHDIDCGRILAEGWPHPFLTDTALTEKLTSSPEVMALMQPEETEAKASDAANAVQKSAQAQPEKKTASNETLPRPIYSIFEAHPLP